MNQPNPAAQQAARAAAQEQLAAKVAVQSQISGRGLPAPRKHPTYNTIIVLVVLLAAIGSFAAMVVRGG